MDVTVKPERPAALDEPPSVEGAVAVAKYFLALYPYAFATGDLEPWDALGHPKCLYCANVRTEVQDQLAQGLHDVGGEAVVQSASGAEVSPGAFYKVDIDLTQSASRSVNAAGETVEEYPGPHAFHFDIAAVWEEGRWAIREATPTRAPGS
ncbi:hypothetical protein HP550_18755 [Cellulomonas humilata]|uniref:DUF6318 domain-containing protein n=1 Tax=Cellulomonas humilata TaxID=144055 RepID=A0A7Y6A471_9CELL|nr:hypothetical protein [Cellulomonas humilata]